MVVEVKPATPARWRDLDRVFGRRGEDRSWCWCQLFLHPSTGRATGSEPGPDNRAALKEQVTRATVAPGLIAYIDGEPVGWTRVGPRSRFPLVTGNRALAKLLPHDPGAWWVTCFAVESRRRRSGVGTALLQAAVEYARLQGASSLEGHPVDVTALRAAKVGGSAVFTGTAAMFTTAGFTEVGRTHPSRPLMRREL
ncbi:MAG TPA: GNAT family N-acetyltransferase [Candidatus Dormibacteraeota bacterium]